MKKILAIILIFSCAIGVATPLYGDDAVKKLGRGMSNVITSPWEILEQMKRVNNSDGPIAAATVGVLKGIVMTGIRAAVGVYEVATFPIPFPRGYRPILRDPEFFFEEMFW